MKCRNCGIEIADRALVCYRCGTATTEARFKPPSSPRSRASISWVSTVLALVLLALLALYVQRAANVESSPALRWVIVGFAVVIIVLRGIARRTRR